MIRLAAVKRESETNLGSDAPPVKKRHSDEKENTEVGGEGEGGGAQSALAPSEVAEEEKQEGVPTV